MQISSKSPIVQDDQYRSSTMQHSTRRLISLKTHWRDTDNGIKELYCIFCTILSTIFWPWPHHPPVTPFKHPWLSCAPFEIRDSLTRLTAENYGALSARIKCSFQLWYELQNREMSKGRADQFWPSRHACSLEVGEHALFLIYAHMSRWRTHERMTLSATQRG